MKRGMHYGWRLLVGMLFVLRAMHMHAAHTPTSDMERELEAQSTSNKEIIVTIIEDVVGTMRKASPGDVGPYEYAHKQFSSHAMLFNRIPIMQESLYDRINSVLSEKKGRSTVYVPMYDEAYGNASATLYYWDDAGKTWFLLGKEKRGLTTPNPYWVWFNFGGSRDEGEADPLDTARREALEETAGKRDAVGKETGPVTILPNDQQLFTKPFYTSVKDRPYHVETKPFKTPYGIAFFLRVKDKVEPTDIKKVADARRAAARKSGERTHIEKTEWRWVDAEEFLHWVQSSDKKNLRYEKLDKNVNVYAIYKETFMNEHVADYVRAIIAEGKKRRRR